MSILYFSVCCFLVSHHCMRVPQFLKIVLVRYIFQFLFPIRLSIKHIDSHSFVNRLLRLFMSIGTPSTMNQSFIISKQLLNGSNHWESHILQLCVVVLSFSVYSVNVGCVSCSVSEYACAIHEISFFKKNYSEKKEKIMKYSFCDRKYVALSVRINQIISKKNFCKF